MLTTTEEIGGVTSLTVLPASNVSDVLFSRDFSSIRFLQLRWIKFPCKTQMLRISAFALQTLCDTEVELGSPEQ